MYKIISKRKNVATVILPALNRKSDSVTLNKVMSNICKLHKLRYLTVGQNCAVIKMFYSPFKRTPEEDKMMEEKFIGIFDLVVNKRVRHP